MPKNNVRESLLRYACAAGLNYAKYPIEALKTCVLIMMLIFLMLFFKGKKRVALVGAVRKTFKFYSRDVQLKLPTFS